MQLNSLLEKEGQADSDYMNAEQLAYFERILLDWKRSITEHNTATKHKLKEDTAPFADLNDRASLEEEFSLALRDRDRERKLIGKIDAALERISSETFGYCELCDVKIGVPRLEARPTAELCIDCKELQEQQEVRIKEKRN